MPEQQPRYRVIADYQGSEGLYCVWDEIEEFAVDLTRLPHVAARICAWWNVQEQRRRETEREGR